MFRIAVFTHQRSLYFGMAKQVSLSTEEGEITVMDFHQPIVTRLKRVLINIDKKWYFKVKDGVACFS